MGRPFRAERGRLRVDLAADERELLAGLFEQVGQLLAAGLDDEEAADPLASLLGLDPHDLPELRRFNAAGGSPGAGPGAQAFAGEGSGQDGPGAADGGGEPAAERDPALARLLPLAHRSDPEPPRSSAA